jgi:hypothetical protein
MSLEETMIGGSYDPAYSSAFAIGSPSSGLCYPPDTDWSSYGDQTTVANLDKTLKARAEALAWYSLASMTAFQIGVCPDVVRPAAAICFGRETWMEAVVDTTAVAGLAVRTIGMFNPYISGGNWYNACGCQGGCTHDRVSEVVLPGPVGAIEEVRIDGVAQPVTSYRVDNGNRLVSLDPDRPWPLRQDMSVSGDEVGSFEVTYYRGAAPNDITRYAAGVLAGEFYKLSKGEKECRIPRNATTVTRGGKTIELDPDLYKALMRIPEVAAVVNIFNPNRLKTAPRVLSPEMDRRPRRTTWIGA